MEYSFDSNPHKFPSHLITEHRTVQPTLQSDFCDIGHILMFC